jgi:hypothetical protein
MIEPFPPLHCVLYPACGAPGERTAAVELGRLAGVTATAVAAPGRGVHVALAGRGWVAGVPAAASSTEGWIWLRLDKAGEGEVIASHEPFLFAAVRLLASGLGPVTREKLAAGVWLPAAFPWHRPHWDACFTQYWRSARGFDPERYVAALAEAGFTHCEVNALQAHLPHEDVATDEFYAPFYSCAPGFNHFVDTALTRGTWPAMYLDANLNHLCRLAALGRRYGLRPGVCMFEPRTMPERFFQRFPTLRGARVDHPFRSRLPRYTMAQDHPVVQRHYREAMQALQRAVPDLAYLSVWTNDSGAGFEHTASLYVGRNGGPYLIREWRNHEKVAEAAGQSIVRFLQNLRSAAAEVNPGFDVLLRIEPFKVEHDTILSGLGPHTGFEAPSLLVRGYALPYQHPKYPTSMGVAGSLFQTWMDPQETTMLRQARARQVEPVLHYPASGVMNHEPLLGLPFPRLLHAKLRAMHHAGITRASCLGGLANVTRTPYWPNPVALQAAQFFPATPIDEVLRAFSTRLVGAADAAALDEAWGEFEAALVWQPLVPLYCSFGFCWQRTWDRPLVPDIEAIPSGERAYYERHGCFQHHNPALNDLGKDVLFELITRESGATMAADMDRELLPRLEVLVGRLQSLVDRAGEQPAGDTGPGARAVFVDLYDRVRAYRHWTTTLRNVCAWCETVHGWIDAEDAGTRRSCEAKLQTAIDLELANTRGLLQLVETSTTEFMIVSAVAENTFCYGENFADHLRTKVRLMEQYRHHPPRIDREIYWRAAPGTAWPEGWLAAENRIAAGGRPDPRSVAVHNLELPSAEVRPFPGAGSSRDVISSHPTTTLP